MENNTNLIESLLEKATEYGKTSYELVKLKALDKTSDVVSTFIPNFIVFVLFATFMLFFNLGMAFWIGEILGKIFFGFLAVGAFYVLAALIVHFFMHRWLKNRICNYFIKKVLNRD